jgi:hypothetical protein
MPDSPVQFRDAQTLRYRSAAQKNVPRDTVRVNITINALVSNADRDHGALQRRMRETLGRFIPVEWVLTAPRRQADTSGFERVTVEANARAPLAENYNLAERARLAGSEGLSLTEPVVNHRLPAAKVATAVQDLRLNIMKEAIEQAKGFSQVSGLNWQLADIEFGVGSLQPEYRNAKGAYREELDDIDSEDAPEPAAERIRLVAAVILKVAPAAARG